MVNRTDDIIGLGCQKSEQVIRRFTFLDLPHGCPFRPNPSEERDRSRVVEGEPHVAALIFVELAEA
jgi:hypothetical protein